MVAIFFLYFIPLFYKERVYKTINLYSSFQNFFRKYHLTSSFASMIKIDYWESPVCLPENIHI